MILINLNGAITDAQDARIPVLDHGFLFGDSVYETLRTYHRKPFLFTRHFARLEHSANAIHLNLPWSRERTFAEVLRTLDATDASELRIRVMATRGPGDLSPDPDSCADPNMIIIVGPVPQIPRQAYERGVNVRISSFYRSVQLAEAKTGNLMRQVLALREAKAAGAFEAILLTPDGQISDGISSNVYLVKNGRLRTPSREAGIVAGITRRVVLELARRAGLEVFEGLLDRREIDSADEMFLTSTTREIVPVATVDGRPVGAGAPGPVTLGLMEAFRREIEVLIQED